MKIQRWELGKKVFISIFSFERPLGFSTVLYSYNCTVQASKRVLARHTIGRNCSRLSKNNPTELVVGNVPPGSQAAYLSVEPAWQRETKLAWWDLFVTGNPS